MCGGTTGHEGLPSLATGPGGDDAGADGTVQGDADATVSADLDAGWFDVGISYADRVLLDIGAPGDAGGGTAQDGSTGYPWPTCPPYAPIGPNGVLVTDPTQAIDLVPAQYDNAGNVLVNDAGIPVPFPDGGACGTYPWLGSQAADECVTSQSDFAYVVLPPCNWCVDAGTARQGPGAGLDRYDVCMKLYACMMKTGCGANGHPAYCLCGDDNVHCDAGGPCAQEELAALESPDPSALSSTILNYKTLDPQTVGFCGHALNNVFSVGVQLGCFTDAGP